MRSIRGLPGFLLLVAFAGACDSTPNVAVQSRPVIVVHQPDTVNRLLVNSVTPVPPWSFHWLPEQGPLLRCAEGYQVTGTGAIDVARLSLMCGPSAGLRELPIGRHVTPHPVPLASTTAARLSLPAEMKCLRIFAAVDHAADGLPPRLLVTLPENSAGVSEVCVGRAAVICPPAGLWCTERVSDRELGVRVEGVAGDAAFVSFWGAKRPPIWPGTADDL